MNVIVGSMVIVGSLIGAGFISGAELVRFFGGTSFLLPLVLSVTLLFFLSLLLLKVGKKYGGYLPAVNAVFGRGAGAVLLVLKGACFLSAAGMLSALDASFSDVAPLPSVAALFVMLPLSRFGAKGLKAVHSLLVPVIIGVLLSEVGRGLQFSFFQSRSLPFGWGVYAGMNLLFSAPVLLEAGAGQKRPVLCALLGCGVIFFCAVIVLGRIYSEGASAYFSEMPFFYVMRERKLFALVSLSAILTSLASSLFPLLNTSFTGKKKTAVRIIVPTAAFACSRLGFSAIVSGGYPAIGALGLTLSVLVVFHECFFEKHHRKIHGGGKNAENERSAHDEVEAEHLPAVHDQIPEPRP